MAEMVLFPSACRADVIRRTAHEIVFESYEPITRVGKVCAEIRRQREALGFDKVTIERDDLSPLRRAIMAEVERLELDAASAFGGDAA